MCLRNDLDGHTARQDHGAGVIKRLHPGASHGKTVIPIQSPIPSLRPTRMAPTIKMSAIHTLP